MLDIYGLRYTACFRTQRGLLLLPGNYLSQCLRTYIVGAVSIMQCMREQLWVRERVWFTFATRTALKLVIE